MAAVMAIHPDQGFGELMATRIRFATEMPDYGEPWKLHCNDCDWTAYVTPLRAPMDLPDHPGHDVVCA
jgi:hypothetical protein